MKPFKAPKPAAPSLNQAEKDAINQYYRQVKSRLAHFRPRRAQLQMIGAIAEALGRSLPQLDSETEVVREGESIVVIEGPTGVGKSLAYLLAGSLMAKARGKKLIISSATIALQEQLAERDVPFFLESSQLNAPFTFAKGRRHYLCPHKLQGLVQEINPLALPDVLWESKPQAGDVETLRRMARLFEEKQFDGDRENLPFAIEERLWSQVTNDRNGCLKKACNHYDLCPFFKARELIKDVDIVIVNHDLLLSDIAMGGGVILPPPEDSFYCIDEAHHLAKKALNQFAAHHAIGPVLVMLDNIPKLLTRLKKPLGDAINIKNALENNDLLKKQLREWRTLLQQNEQNFVPDEGSLHNNSLWLWEGGAVPEHLQVVTHNTELVVKTWFSSMVKLNDQLAKQRREYKHESTDALLFEQPMVELGMILTRAKILERVWSLFNKTPKEGAPPIAKWLVLTANHDKKDYFFHASPVSSAAELSYHLWRRAAGAILTSATLRANQSFNLFLQQTGLSRFPKVTTLALESPFDYSHTKLVIPPFRANPKDSAAHTKEIIDYLPQVISTTEALGTLVLFTSKKQMTEVFDGLNPALAHYVKVQENGSKKELIEQHRRDIDAGLPSVLFGLDSFAEGLDLKEHYCVHVIICKLPFTIPNDPIEKTQSLWLEKSGRNPFLELSVAEASIKLTQAVGRLIRTEHDYGRVSILDNRLRNPHLSYAKLLLNTLPWKQYHDQ